MAAPSEFEPYKFYNKTIQPNTLNGTALSSPPSPVFVIISNPPPPPPVPNNPTFSPALIAIIAILAAVFLLVSYYTMVAKYCCTSRRSSLFRWRRSRSRRRDAGEADDQDPVDDNNITWPLIVAPVSQGLEDSVIQALPVVEFRKLDGNAPRPESGITDCAVCLSEFQEGEKLRLLPACCHSFHIGCIDMWLYSHANCPLCRSKVVSNEQQQTSSASSVDSTSSAPATPTAADHPVSGSPDSSQPLLPTTAHHHLHIIDEDNNTEETEDNEGTAVDTSKLRPLNREQKATGVLGYQMQRLGFRCFSTGRASLSPLAINEQTHNFEGQDVRRMERSSSMSIFTDRRVIPLDDDDDDHSNINEQQTMMHIGHTVLNVGPSSSSSPSSSLCLPHENSTAMGHVESSANLHDDVHSRENDQQTIRDMKCLSLNLHNGHHHDTDLKNMPSDPSMARMALSLLGTRSVKRSFSGGRLFGFKVMQQKTNTGSSGINNNVAPPPPSTQPTDEASSDLPV